jgi:hypothetical protein
LESILHRGLPLPFEDTSDEGLGMKKFITVNTHSTRVNAMRTIFLAGLAGAIIGLCWSHVIHAAFSNGLTYGFAIGAFLGFLMYMAQRVVSARFHIRKEKTYAVAGSVIGISLLVGIASAVVTLVIRILFS